MAGPSACLKITNEKESDEGSGPYKYEKRMIRTIIIAVQFQERTLDLACPDPGSVEG